MDGLRDVPAQWLSSGGIRKGIDTVCQESALSISISDGHELSFSLGITMRTPGCDEELVIGLLFSEGIINSSDQITELTIHNDKALAVIPNINQTNISQFLRRKSSTSSCGICGKESISNLLHIHGPKLSENINISSSVINNCTDKLRKNQLLFEKSGGAHACGLFSLSGELLFSAEDIGRHNAMDKLVGKVLLSSKKAFLDSFILFSGRLSFELVHKARRAGIPVLIAIGAPSSLAIDIAIEHGLTLVGFTKNNNMTVYSGRGRISH